MRPAPQLAEFIAHAVAALADRRFLRLVLSSPRVPESPVKRILGRPVRLKEGLVLSLTLREARRDVTRNLTPAELPAWLEDALRTGFAAALLETTRGDWQLAPAGPGHWRLVAHPPRRDMTGHLLHDRPPCSVLDDVAQDWLHALGLTDKNGGVVPRAAAKHRQIRRFAEILHGLVEQMGWRDGRPVRALDAGSGKGYLTFAVWHLLRREFGCAADVLGVEARAGLVDFCRGVAGALGLEGLRFEEGTIATAPAGPLDLLIALHACNTATDEAIRRGIAGRAGIILVAPCCHQEVRPRLGRPTPLAPVLDHGLFAERMAEWVTDALRMLYLEWAGYRVKALEFVSLEHTAKNLLLAAMREARSVPFENPVARGRYQALKEHFGLGPLALDAPLAIGSPG